MYLGGRISRLFIGVAILFGIIVLGVFAMNRPVSAVAGINKHLNFQGRLYNAQGAIVPDGNYNIQFKIYQDGAGTTAGNPGGTLEWTENWLNSGGNGVQIKNGYLSVELGSVNAFGTSVDWNQDTLWLSMNIGDTTSCTITTDFDTDCSGDGEMVPMKRMSSAVYALNAGQLGGLDSTQFVQLAQGVQTDASTNTTSIYLNKTAGGNFLQLQSSSTDVFTLSNSGDIEFGANNDHTISVATAGAATGGYDLTVSAGTGGSGTGSAGGDLVLQGGAAGGTDGNGGNIVINAGAKTGTGTDGTISIGTSNTSAITLGADTTVTGSSFTVSGSSSLALNKGSDYSTISGNDVNFGSGSVFRLTGASSQTITGIAGGTDGRMITLINSSSFNATLANLSGSSSSANQISTGTGADVILSVGGAISMIYDSGASKWRVVAAAADSAGAGGVTLQGSTPGTADVGNINVTGTIIGDIIQGTSGILAPSLDVVSAGALAIGTSDATSITLGQSGVTTTVAGDLSVTGASTFNDDVTIATGKTLTLTGDSRTNINGYTPSAGMITYDTDSNQLLVYNGTKWMSDRSSTTKIVAASNSSQAMKDAADYVADGTSDESEINSALTAAAGGTVYLAEGTFVAGGTILVPNNTILAGAGNGTTIELADLDATDNLIENKDSTAGNATPGSGVVIRDLKLDGRSDLNTAGTQYGIYFSDMGSGTGASAVQGATIENLRITRFRNDGAYLTASSNNTITANNFRNNGAVGLSINASSNNNVISNNRFQGNGAEGFVLSSSSYNNISGNNSEANTTLGMNFTSGGSRNTISGNNINSNGTSGMRLSGETRSTIVGNVIRGGGASNYGIYMLNSSNNNAVSSNNIYDTGSAGYTNGIFLDVASYNNLTNNVIGDSSCTFECRAININNAGATNNFIASNNIDIGASIRDTGTGTLYGGQNSGTAYLIQPSQDITIGGASNTTTIQGNTAVTLSGTTGTTQVCQNGSGYLSTCDASYLAPTATNFIQNQNSTDQTANFRISGVAQANTSVLTPLVGRATAGTLSIGTDANSTAITIGQSGVTTTNAGNLTVSGTTALDDNVTVASGKTLRLTGDSRANITSIGSPAAGMITYDTDNNQLLTYNGTKWKADGKDAILVAANDSSQADKDAADYVADGTADDVEIQAALNAADPAGSGRKTGKVYLFAGTYNVSTDITIENNTTIAGAGRGTLLSLVSTTSAVKVLTNDDTSTGEGVTIQNLRIDGNNGTVGAQYGIYLDNMGGGTGASARQGAKVNNVILTRFNTANMYLNASSHGTFSGISSQASDGDGIGLSSSYYNTFTGNTLSGNTGDGFDVSGSHDVTLVGNTIQNNSGAGLSASTSSYTLSVTGNTFRQNGTNGITFSQVTYSTVSNNSFYSNTGDGINVVGGASSSLSITGNNIYNSSGDGVDLTATHTSITGNTLVSNTDGIVVRNGSNEVTGNISRSNSNAGIALDGTSADDNTVSGNTVSSNTVYGIYLSNADDNSITGNRVFNNGGLTTNNSIYLTASDSNSIQSNTISDTNASSNNYSINIFNSTSDNNYLSGNTLGTGSVNDSGTGTIYGGQVDASGNYVVQPTGDIELQGDTNVTGTLTATTALQAPLLDTSAVEALYIGTTNASSINLMKDTNLVGDLTLDAAADRTISIGTSAASTAGSQLTIAAGTGGSGTGSVGGDLVLQGGNAGGTNANGGNLYLDAGAGTGTGSGGSIYLGYNQVGDINIGTGTGNYNINIGTGTGSQNVVIGATTGGGSTTIQSDTGGLVLDASGGAVAIRNGSTTNPNIDINAAGNMNLNIGSGQAFAINNNDSSTTYFSIDSSTGQITAGASTLLYAQGDAYFQNGITLQGGGSLDYTTPLGTNLDTVINVPNYAMGAFGTIMSFGISNCTNPADLTPTCTGSSYTPSTARGILLADARNTAHQATIGVLSPDENQIFGFSWNGSNSDAYLSNTANTVVLQGNSLDLITATNNGGAANVGIGNDASSGYALDVTGDINSSTQYRIGGNTTLTDSALTFTGSGGSSVQGADDNNLTLQGGNATTTNANGGNLVLSGGAGDGTGATGLVVLNTPAFATTANDANCFAGGALVASSCSIAQSSIDNSAAVIVGFNTVAQTATMPDPTVSTAGKIIYVTAANGSEDFTLSVNGGGTGNTIAMRQNTTATMIWNGSDWTAAGASSSTTLQSAYDNTLQSAGGAELVVSSTGNTNGLTIRDSSVNPVNGTLLSVQSNSAANLFSVNSNVTEYASNAGAETYGASTTTFPASTWSALTGATVSRNTTTSNIATGQGSAQAATTTSANSGIKNQLNTALTASQHYNVSFTAKLASGTFTDMGVYYSIDGSADSVTCTTGEAIKTSVWTKVNCTFTAPSSGITSSNSINIRQVAGGTARTFYIDNLSVTIAADYNYATDGTVNDTGNFATNWTSTGTGSTVTHNTSDGQEASDSAQAVITTGGSNRGVRNQIAINPLTSTLYRVSVYAKQTAGAAFTDFGIRYSRDGGTNFTDCVDYNTQTVDNTWTQVTCYMTTSGTAPTNPYMYFVAGSSANRTFLIDTFSMTLASKSTPNVQIGGGVAGGPTTLFTLDKGASAPIAANNDDLLGSMYYDTTLGKLQCYEADGWGACGSSPDNIITISPEYTNAVLHGTGIGTMNSDLCSDTLNINDGSSGQATICGTNETYNFYKWTSPQSSAQTYSIYVTYQLPSTFKAFQSGETSIMGRTDDANATVDYQIYRNNTSSGLTTCGSAVTVSTGSVSSWQTGVATGAADPSTCGFVGGDSVVFKINVTASQNANAYVGNLNFTFSNR